jgi:hypothetical protein
LYIILMPFVHDPAIFPWSTPLIWRCFKVNIIFNGQIGQLGSRCLLILAFWRWYLTFHFCMYRGWVNDFWQK